MMYVGYFVVALLVALVVTPYVRRLATFLGCIDVPRPPRHLHKQPVPKMGGLAVYGAFAVVTVLYMAIGHIPTDVLPHKFIWALLAGGAVLMVEGFLDDKYDLPAKYLWLGPIIAASIVVGTGVGVGITSITNPFGGSISLNFLVLGLVPASGVFVWLWLMGMMFTTKFLDGLDGLVAGIGAVAGLTLFAVSLTEKVNQPMTATLAIILVGALVGYLYYAFHPAQIFFGEGGSKFVGFSLAVLSVILGGKIATAFLVMGVPILDVAWVIAQRIWSGQSPFRGDRLHLHFRLLDAGFSQRQAALLLYGVSAAFGFTAVFLQSFGKLVAFGVLLVLMIVLVGIIVRQYRKKVVA
jgi:UDP-GlcNAc:undecaprenyl-phosphate GlcNAc-1-phosphate transferase